MIFVRSLVIFFSMALLLISPKSFTAQEVSEMVKVNQIGYLVDQVKVAYVSDESNLSVNSWRVKSAADNSTAYEGSTVSSVIEDEATGEFVYKLTFDDFTEEGSYYIEVDGVGRSYDFEISNSTYNDVFDLLMKGFYFQRSGEELKSEHAGKWAKPAEYANDAFIYAGFDGSNVIKGEKIDAAGGWRDAGDPNKKVVTASIAVYQLLSLYENFPSYIAKSVTNIPNDPDFPDLPDYLTEVKVSLDWLLKMQRDDGAVWHAVTQADFYLEGLGHEDPNTRFLMPVSTTATADFAAVMAAAYRVFKEIDLAYASGCLEAAEKAWVALNTSSIWNNPTLKGDNGSLQYPEQKGYSGDPPGINNTANYEDDEDADERHWAAGELAISTNKNEYHEYFKSGIGNGIWYPSLWPAVENLANFSYAQAFKDQNNAIISKLKNYISAYMDIYLERIETTGFGTCLSAADYFWGSNNVAGQFAYTFLISYDIIGDQAYENAALSMLNYILGANSLNQTFVSGIGDRPVKNIFHLPSWLDGIDEVVPGLIPGGPNQFLTPSDVVHANLITLESPPPAKCYVDSEFSFASNETVILESAAWAYVTGYFYYIEIDEDNDGFAVENDCDDGDALVNPAQEEIAYNGIDDDCDPLTLDDDLDEDGFVQGVDCDDNNSSVNPGITEIPYNALDDDCDPLTLDDDLDEDGFPQSEDCDDNNSSVNPGITEIPYNTLDDDCDPLTLDDDLDEDGFPQSEDCNDDDPTINPAAEDIPNNGIDENCDGEDLVSSLDGGSNSLIKVYPNPVLSGLTIDLGEGQYSIKVTNSIGQQVFTKSFILDRMELTKVDWVNGLHYIKIRNLENGSTEVVKVLKI